MADCSGRTTLLGRQLGIREADPKLDKIALYCHYDDVIRSSGDDAGTIAIIATPFGWMWLIPFAGGGASVGALMHRAWYLERKQAGADKDAIWAEVLDGTPAVSRRLVGATRARPLEATSDFQYRTRRLAGDGWVAIGDAGAFVDPVFSSGSPPRAAFPMAWCSTWTALSGIPPRPLPGRGAGPSIQPAAPSLPPTRLMFRVTAPAFSFTE